MFCQLSRQPGNYEVLALEVNYISQLRFEQLNNWANPIQLQLNISTILNIEFHNTKKSYLKNNYFTQFHLEPFQKTSK